MSLKEKVRDQLIIDEGFRLFVYDDANGKAIQAGSVLEGHPTIGIGRNLAGLGISDNEAYFLWDNDFNRVLNDLSAFSWFLKLNEPRQAVMLNMAFNMGTPKLLEFVKMIGAIERGDFIEAALEMEDSDWHKDVKLRAERLERQMHLGIWSY